MTPEHETLIIQLINHFTSLILLVKFTIFGDIIKDKPDKTNKHFHKKDALNLIIILL